MNIGTGIAPPFRHFLLGVYTHPNSRRRRLKRGQGAVHETIRLDGSDAAHLPSHGNRSIPLLMASGSFGYDPSFGFQKQFAGSRSPRERSRLALEALPTRSLARLRFAAAINSLNPKSRPLSLGLVLCHLSFVLGHLLQMTKD
jgi:hypothetical protein